MLSIFTFTDATIRFLKAKLRVMQEELENIAHESRQKVKEVLIEFTREKMILQCKVDVKVATTQNTTVERRSLHFIIIRIKRVIKKSDTVV